MVDVRIKLKSVRFLCYVPIVSRPRFKLFLLTSVGLFLRFFVSFCNFLFRRNRSKRLSVQVEESHAFRDLVHLTKEMDEKKRIGLVVPGS